MEKYIDLARELGAVHARLISPEEIFFDRRVLLKCRWGCEYHCNREPGKCGLRDLSPEQGEQAVRGYRHILLVHSHDRTELSRMTLEIERRAFLDGLYLAFTVRACHLCRKCRVEEGRPCLMPEKLRPCEAAFGIDVYRTVRHQGLPVNVLQSKEDTPDRYGFVLVD